jgi:hypothetical protein
MRLTIRHISFLLAGIVLSAVMVLLATSRPEYCGQPNVLASHFEATEDAPSPTLAPPQKVVVVFVETDKPDIEIGWAKN